MPLQMLQAMYVHTFPFGQKSLAEELHRVEYVMNQQQCKGGCFFPLEWRYIYVSRGKVDGLPG